MVPRRENPVTRINSQLLDSSRASTNMCIVLESPRGAETCPQVDLFKKYDHWETGEGQKPCDVKAVAKARAGKFHAMASK